MLSISFSVHVYAGLIVKQSSKSSKGYPKEFLDLFNDIDLDRGGTLSEIELRFALNRFGLPASDEYVNEIMRQVSRNLDRT